MMHEDGRLEAATAVSPEWDALLPGYRVPTGHFDELLDERGLPRAHWLRFARYAGELAPAHLADAQARVNRQIHENGITYNIYAAADGPTRPWALDVLPLIVPSPEWEPLARGLRQRARLLNAIGADIYGSQSLLSEGLIPSALVHGHPGFLRPCYGVLPPGGIFLHHVAFDLARGPDGVWRVIGTRTQAPSGAGYALENRMAVSRLFPDAFRELRVQLLAPFFRTLQEMLLGCAPCDGDTPHVVLLTPGPYNETYFEHAYLSQYLGFTLVEGGDLAVREDRVYLKTVSGLRQVHAVLRRLDDDFCDPLELRSDSTLGVPGLVQAWRAGRVLVANALGAGVLETPALLGFLSPICERLLGETLDLPSVETWWCGESAALAHVGPRSREMIVKPAFPHRSMEPVFLAELEPRTREAWHNQLLSSPEQFVLEDYLPLSHAPTWHETHLQSRALMLRAYLVSDGRGDYRVLPGGLCRIATTEKDIVSTQRGGSSKDAWVLSESPVEHVSLLKGRLQREDIARSERMVSSRSAENLFWLGRYAERAENCARLLRAVLSRLPDSDAFPATLSALVIRTSIRQGLITEDWELGETRPEATADTAFGIANDPLRLHLDETDVGCLGPNFSSAARLSSAGDDGTPALRLVAGSERTSHALELALIRGLFDRSTCHSLAFNLEQTIRVAGAVRDRLSSDNWRLLNQLYQALMQPRSPGEGLAEALELIDRSIVSLVAVGGLEMAHMTRDDGWRFLSLGRHLERALYVTTTVAEVAGSGDPEDPTLLEWLLDLSDSLITYRARYMRLPEWMPVVELLLFDRLNPRSAAFQFAKLAKHVQLLPDVDLVELVASLERAAGSARTTDPFQGELFERDGELERFLPWCEALALRLSDALTLRYFSHVYEPTRATVAI